MGGREGGTESGGGGEVVKQKMSSYQTCRVQVREYIIFKM